MRAFDPGGLASSATRLYAVRRPRSRFFFCHPAFLFLYPSSSSSSPSSFSFLFHDLLYPSSYGQRNFSPGIFAAVYFRPRISNSPALLLFSFFLYCFSLFSFSFSFFLVSSSLLFALDTGLAVVAEIFAGNCCSGVADGIDSVVKKVNQLLGLICEFSFFFYRSKKRGILILM